MKIIKILLGTIVAIALALLALVFVLWVKPPDILRVGANYSAKIVCSNVFLAGRDPDEVLRVDVQAPGIALLRLMHVSVDREQGVVRAGFLGFIGDGLAQFRPGKGCTVVPDGKLDMKPISAPAPSAPVPPPAAPNLSSAALWPDGTAV